MKRLITIFFIFALSHCVFAKQDTCITLRKRLKECKRGQRTQVNITCGGRWYRYWTDEYEMHQSNGIDEDDIPESIKKGMCVQVKYETMTMDCYEFLDYKVSLFFCRKQKKRICKRLKEDGFGDITLRWPRKRKKKRLRGDRYRAYDKEQGYIVKPCSKVLD